MSTFSDQVWRDYEVDGAPESGSHKPVKSEIRELFDDVDTNKLVVVTPVGDSKRYTWLGKGGGIDDDAPMFHDISDLLLAKGGGTVDLPPGTFLLKTRYPTGVFGTPIVMHSNMHIRGSGRNATVLKLLPQTKETPTPVIPAMNAIVINGTKDALIHDVSVTHLSIEGGWTDDMYVGSPAYVTGTIAVDGIKIEFVEQFLMAHLRLHDIRGYGITIAEAGHRKGLVHDVDFDGTGADGLDTKDEGSNPYYDSDLATNRMSFKSLFFTRIGRHHDDSACIDCRGMFDIADIHIKRAFTANGEAGVRLRPVLYEPSQDRGGRGGIFTSVRGLYCENTAPTRFASALYIFGEKSYATHIRARNMFTGVNQFDANSVSDLIAENCSYGLIQGGHFPVARNIRAINCIHGVEIRALRGIVDGLETIGTTTAESLAFVGPSLDCEARNFRNYPGYTVANKSGGNTGGGVLHLMQSAGLIGVPTGIYTVRCATVPSVGFETWTVTDPNAVVLTPAVTAGEYDAHGLRFNIYRGTVPFVVGDGFDITVRAPGAVVTGSGLGNRINPTAVLKVAPPGTGTWNRGDIAWNTQVLAGGIPGWVCVIAGTPGTWKAMAPLEA